MNIDTIKDNMTPTEYAESMDYLNAIFETDNDISTLISAYH